MVLSENGRKLLIQWEGKRNRVYKDSAGIDTIGVGHVVSNGETYLTDDQIEQYFIEDIGKFEKFVSDHVCVPLTQNQFDALVSFCFNVGTRAFENSTLIEYLNRGEYDTVPTQLRRWNKIGSKVSKGLTNRRENEIKLWESS